MNAGNTRSDLAHQVEPYLVFVRRFSRALTGSQIAGDDLTAAFLESLVADPGSITKTDDAKPALYRRLAAVWHATGNPIDPPGPAEGPMAEVVQTRLRPLPLNARIAVLLRGLEDFTPGQIATILELEGSDTASALIDAGRQAIASQIAGRILIIEDEPLVAMDIKSIAQRAGHQVIAITDTHRKAVAAADHEAPNLIIADIRLADGSSGIEAVDEILESVTVPVVFVTAFPELLLTGERPEPTYLIAKPFEASELSTLVNQALFFAPSPDRGVLEHC